ncbi:MAG: enoyl-CoA hydratase-related protein [Bacteriovoracaceae bacterium]
MESKFFNFNIDARGVGTLTLTREEVHNAFNDEMIADLTEFFKNTEQFQSVRVLLLQSEGRSFSAGADLNWMKSMVDYSEAENVADSLKLQEMFEAMDKAPVPIVAKVQGATLGGGCGLICCADYVVASTKAKFGFTEAKLGLLPAVISTFVMPKIGFSQARALFTTGERFGAERALNIGLVHRVTTPENLDEETHQVLLEYLSAGPEASKLAKTLCFDVWNSQSEPEALKYTRELIAKVRIGEEAQGGMKAMLNKEKPSWIQNKE